MLGELESERTVARVDSLESWDGRGRNEMLLFPGLIILKWNTDKTDCGTDSEINHVGQVVIKI